MLYATVFASSVYIVCEATWNAGWVETRTNGNKSNGREGMNMDGHRQDVAMHLSIATALIMHPGVTWRKPKPLCTGGNHQTKCDISGLFFSSSFLPGFFATKLQLVQLVDSTSIVAHGNGIPSSRVNDRATTTTQSGASNTSVQDARWSFVTSASLASAILKLIISIAIQVRAGSFCTVCCRFPFQQDTS